MGHNGFFFPALTKLLGTAESCFKLLLRGNPRVTQWQKNASTPSPRPKEEAGEAEHTSESPSMVYSTQIFIFFPQSWARGTCRHTKPRGLCSARAMLCAAKQTHGQGSARQESPQPQTEGGKGKNPITTITQPLLPPQSHPKNPSLGLLAVSVGSVAGSSSGGDTLAAASTPLRGWGPSHHPGPSFLSEPKGWEAAQRASDPGMIFLSLRLGRPQGSPGSRAVHAGGEQGKREPLTSFVLPWGEALGKEGGKKIKRRRKRSISVYHAHPRSKQRSPPASSHLPEPPGWFICRGLSPVPSQVPAGLWPPLLLLGTACVTPQGLHPCSPPACLFLRALSCSCSRAEPATASCTELGKRWAHTRLGSRPGQDGLFSGHAHAQATHETTETLRTPPQGDPSLSSSTPVSFRSPQTGVL